MITILSCGQHKTSDLANPIEEIDMNLTTQTSRTRRAALPVKETSTAGLTVSLTQLENALLALPTFTGRSRFDEAVRAAVVCCACTQIGANISRLAAYTGYETTFIFDCLARLRAKQYLLTGSLSLSALANILPQSGAIIELLKPSSQETIMPRGIPNFPSEEEKRAFFKARSEKALAAKAIKRNGSPKAQPNQQPPPAPRSLTPATTPVPAVVAEPEPVAINFSICYEEGETLLLSKGESIAELRRALWMLTAMLNGRD